MSVQRCATVQVHKCLGVQMYRCTSAYECTGVQVYGCAQGRIGNEKVICHVVGLGAPYRKFQSQLQ